MAFSMLFQISRGLTLLAVYIVFIVIYRLYFSPLAKFPGPKIAAVTSLYHFYYDVVKGGHYVWVIEEMHKKYGPIVRIRPDVLHVNDPEFIDPIFGTAGKRRDKYKIAINGFATHNAGLGTTHHDLHRVRRSALNPFFSKQNIRKLDPILQKCLTKVLKRLNQNAKKGEPMRMNLLFSATTSDIISDYCFGQSRDFLEREDLNEPFFKAWSEAGKGYHFACWNPWLVPTISFLPQWVAVLLMPDIEEIKGRLNNVRKEIKDHIVMDTVGRTVFHSMITNPNLSDADRSEERLMDESRVLLGAGTDTTAYSLATTTYHILADPGIFKKLKKELVEAIPDPNSIPSSEKIEALPYLTAVIQEGVRLHPGASLRQERVAPDEDLYYEDVKAGKKYVIPRGTPVGMTPPILNMNEEIYPSPKTFNPDRFLENPRLDKYQITFSRGPRRCLGINLAYAELYTILAGIFRKYDLYDGTGKQEGPTLELYQTGREDVDMFADAVSPLLREGSLGVRVMVR